MTRRRDWLVPLIGIAATLLLITVVIAIFAIIFTGRMTGPGA